RWWAAAFGQPAWVFRAAFWPGSRQCPHPCRCRRSAGSGGGACARVHARPPYRFAAGEFAPQTREGHRLIAHELAHVIQQAESSAPRLVQRQQAGPATPPPTAGIVMPVPPSLRWYPFRQWLEWLRIGGGVMGGIVKTLGPAVWPTWQAGLYSTIEAKPVLSIWTPTLQVALTMI